MPELNLLKVKFPFGFGVCAEGKVFHLAGEARKDNSIGITLWLRKQYDSSEREIILCEDRSDLIRSSNFWEDHHYEVDIKGRITMEDNVNWTFEEVDHRLPKFDIILKQYDRPILILYHSVIPMGLKMLPHSILTQFEFKALKGIDRDDFMKLVSTEISKK